MKKAVAGMLFAVLAVCVAQISFAEEIEFLKGFTLGGGITLNLQNLQNANKAEDSDGNPIDENKTPTLGEYSVDLTVEKKFDDNNTAFIHLETGRGDINNYLNAVAGVNRDADDSGVVSVTEAWFEHKFTDKFAMTAGIIDPTQAVDDNAYANDETTQFLGSMFRNAANVEFSDNAFGLKATYEADTIDFAVQYIDASDYKDITRNGFASAQVNFKPGFIENMEGNYRVFGWTNTNDYAKLDGTGDGKEKNYGFGLSFDQQFSDIFGGFARYSWANGAIDNGIDSSNTWSLGLQATVKGLSEKDVVALAYGQVMPSDEYKDNVNGDAKSENHLEVYYSWNVTDYLAISPDFQMVENPFYNGDDDTAYVGSIRMQISF
jgi:hypothetical protein